MRRWQWRFAAVACFVASVMVAPVVAQSVVRIYGTVSNGTFLPILVDSTGRLIVTLSGGTITPTSVSVPASTCASPAINEVGATTTGIAFTATPSWLLCVAGNAVVTGAASVVTLGSGVSLALGDSTSLSQTAANRIGIATGDSLHLISGGLGIGVVPPSAGEVQASGNLITAASLKFLTAGTMADILDGKFRFQNAGGTAGFLLNGTAESVMGVKSRTDGAYATVDALGYRVSGAAGASGTCASVTVVNGLVTVCTP